MEVFVPSAVATPLVAAMAAGVVAVPSSASASTPPCGALPYDPAAPPVYSHVVVIMAFNKTTQALGMWPGPILLFRRRTRI
ncbi:MAG: hypothetical protein M3140_03120 [Actinomycetota bacterium]|nr:hypothetical protein [Actinomycetota bacterium]